MVTNLRYMLYIFFDIQFDASVESFSESKYLSFSEAAIWLHSNAGCPPEISEMAENSPVDLEVFMGKSSN